MINTVQQALEDVYVALGGQEDIDRLTVSQVLAKIYNVLGGTGDHGDETVPQIIDLISTVASPSVTVEALSATENKTYTAPAGKAYSPVTVNVSGGGGDSDWTSAEVTFVNSDTTTEYTVQTCRLYGGDFVTVGSSVISASTVTTIPLYKGKAYLPFSAILGADSGTMPTVSGDISMDMQNNAFAITGNGTITCKGTGGQ